MKRLKWRGYCHTSLLAIFLACLHTSVSTKRNVSIPVLAPMFGQKDRFAYVTSMKYAFDLINKRDDILKNYTLVPTFYDTVASIPQSAFHIHEIIACDQIIHVTELGKQVVRCASRSPPPVIIGPAFSSTTIYTSRSIILYNILQYSYASTSPVLDNFADYPFLVRSYPGTSVFSSAHVSLMKRFAWERAGIFLDHHAHDGIFNRISENLIAQLQINNITVVGVESVDAGAAHLKTPDKQIRERLEKFKAADIKIIFAQFTDVGAYRIFCQAYQLGMLGKNYVWIVHPRVGRVKKWLEVPKSYLNVEEKCTPEQYKEIGERMLFFDHQNFRRDGVRTISGLTAAEYIDYIDKHRPNETDPVSDMSHGYAFDTIWNMALTLNDSLPELWSNFNSTLDNMLYQNVDQGKLLRTIAHEVEFEGITGPMKLHRKQGRIGTLTLYQIRGELLCKVGYFEGTAGILTLDYQAEADLWIDGRIPNDRSLQRTVLFNVPLGLYLPICTVAGLGIVLAIGVLFFNIYNRKERYIRKSAPLFNNIIIFGIMMCLSTVAFFGYPVDLGETEKFLTMCKLRSWVLCLGFSLSFGSMFVKTWRVYKIFTNRKLKYSIDRLSNTSLIGMVFAIVAIDILVLVLWQFIDPMEVEMSNLPTEVDPSDPNAKLLPVLYSCYSNNQAKWVSAIYVLKGVLLLYGLFLAYETRNVQFEHLNDSRMIGFSVYNVAVMSILGGLLRIILNESYFKESYVITAICIIFPSLGTLCLIFLPKVVRYVKRDNLASETETSDGIVIEGPGMRNVNDFHLRKDSVCSEGVTSVSSSLPCSNSRIMPIYEEATSTTSPDGSSYTSESPA